MFKAITLVELPEFQKQVGLLMTVEELDGFKNFLAFNPEAGVVIPETGGVRKLRWGIRHQGKRGGARVIYYYQDGRYPILLLTIYAKNEREDMSSSQCHELAQLVSLIKKNRRGEQ